MVMEMILSKLHKNIQSVMMPHLSHQVVQDGWMTCDFTSFLTAFQSYQDDVWMIMKAVCNETPFMDEKMSPRVRIELDPLDQ